MKSRCFSRAATRTFLWIFVLETNLSKFYQVWKDEPTLLSVAQAGVQGILAYGWYLDHLSELWSDFYNNEPFQSSGWTPELESYILGGEASAWGEQVNYANFDQTVWPRTSGTAERWSCDTAITNTKVMELYFWYKCDRCSNKNYWSYMQNEQKRNYGWPNRSWILYVNLELFSSFCYFLKYYNLFSIFLFWTNIPRFK